jgi:hypothetical protein
VSGTVDITTDSAEIDEDRREGVGILAEERTDELGALARVVLALDEGETPRDTDLAAAGLPTREELGVEGGS